MIRQLYWTATASAASGAKKLGLVREAARYMALWTRNREGWRPHLDASKAFMLKAAHEASSHDVVLVAGSGWCLDVPLAELSTLFNTVVLLDAVQPKRTRDEAARLANVRLISADLTGCLAPLSQGKAGPNPSRLIDASGAALPDGLAPDLTISANTLAQLPLLPWELLWQSGTCTDAELETFAQDVIQAHLYWLESLPGLRCLITDHAWIARDESGATLATDPLHDVATPEPAERWQWSYAPRPQAHPARDIIHSVGAALF